MGCVSHTTGRRPNRIVVVGAGLAGLRTVAELRAQGYAGHLMLLGNEGMPPYDRPPLSKELLTRTSPLWLADDLGYDLSSLADEIRLAAPAAGLSRTGDGPVVHLSDGADLAADAVVVATGSRPLRPHGWDHALVLHGASDADALRATITPGARLVVVGAGWIGAEVAGVAAAAGAAVTVLEAGPTPLGRQLGPDLGRRTTAWYAEAGVDLHTDATVARVEADGVHLADGRAFAADVVLCAIGARPATEWLGNAVTREASGHLRVDAGGASATPGVWAVGDVAARPHPTLGRVPGGHWSAALSDPAPLARALLGIDDDGTPEPAPYVYSTQLGHHLTVFGRLHGTDGAPVRLLDRGDVDAGPWTTLALEDDALVGAVIADAPREVAAVRRLLSGTDLARLDPVLAADPTTKLRSAVVP
ncbi:NAD(P)/FAD-dependent oxidoreductase [Occultella aeris]|uniref:Benzene 1,2-dioxygenase system ferredoxin--NAD(+) reductase subunit n=1 Tax=Occultella aeris TaxID=2761496 RepID=A0A7M4DLN8_9MICO|nr:Benzene 1,2-dioxygenase system ferredoxin--NAD(+) reductase subunit [Occultella aeris]